MAEGAVDRRARHARIARNAVIGLHPHAALGVDAQAVGAREGVAVDIADQVAAARRQRRIAGAQEDFPAEFGRQRRIAFRSEEHTSELQSLMRISYAVFCLKKKNKNEKIETQQERTQFYIVIDYM